MSSAPRRFAGLSGSASRERVLDAQTGEAAEVGVVREDRRALLDRERGDLRVGDERPARRGLLEGDAVEIVENEDPSFGGRESAWVMLTRKRRSTWVMPVGNDKSIPFRRFVHPPARAALFW